MHQVISRRPLTAETRVRFLGRQCENCGGQIHAGSGFSPSTSVFPCQYHSTNAPYPFIHLPPTLYNISLPTLQFFPCHYHSTNAPYPFIHLPPTLYNVSLPTLQFPLSVSFHQCSIPIHSPTTHTILCFSPSTSVFPSQYHSTIAPYPFIHLPPTLYNVSLPVLQFSPVSIIPPMLHTHSFTYHPRYIMFLSQHFSFPCQYHSTNAAYSSFSRY